MVVFNSPSFGPLGTLNNCWLRFISGLYRSLAVRRVIADDQAAVIVLDGGENLTGGMRMNLLITTTRGLDQTIPESRSM